MHASVPAPSGKWGDAHLSVHAQSERDRNIGVRRMYTDTDTGVQHDQQERWGQCNFRYPPNATQIRELKPWRQVQGGVVEPKTLLGFGGLGKHGQWESTDRSVMCCDSVIRFKIAHAGHGVGVCV